MTLTAYAFLALAVVVGGLWLILAVHMALAIERRVHGALLGSEGGGTRGGAVRRVLLAMRELPFCLLGSAASMVNALWLLVYWAWCRMRGKRSPPAPKR
jgi:hypothetical protein